MAPLPVGQGSKEPARGGVLGVSSATSFFLEFPLAIPALTDSDSNTSGGTHPAALEVRWKVYRSRGGR